MEFKINIDDIRHTLTQIREGFEEFNRYARDMASSLNEISDGIVELRKTFNNFGGNQQNGQY